MPEKNDIKRDHWGRITSRLTEVNGAHKTILYSYNKYGDMSGSVTSVNDVVTFESKYDYEYDEYLNKTKKTIESTTVSADRGEKIKTIYDYINDYDEKRISKKACFYGGMKLYENFYYYKDGKLDRIKRYNSRTGRFALWRTESFAYQDHVVESTIYIAGHVLSHYHIYRLYDGETTHRQLLNPSKGKYYWYLSSFDEDHCSIYVGENYLSGPVLSEVLDYVSHIKKAASKSFLAVIECSDTMAAPSVKELREVEDRFSENGVITAYSP